MNLGIHFPDDGLWSRPEAKQRKPKSTHLTAGMMLATCAVFCTEMVQLLHHWSVNSLTINTADYQVVVVVFFDWLTELFEMILFPFQLYPGQLLLIMFSESTTDPSENNCRLYVRHHAVTIKLFINSKHSRVSDNQDNREQHRRCDDAAPDVFFIFWSDTIPSHLWSPELRRCVVKW